MNSINSFGSRHGWAALAVALMALVIGAVSAGVTTTRTNAAAVVRAEAAQSAAAAAYTAELNAVVAEAQARSDAADRVKALHEAGLAAQSKEREAAAAARAAARYAAINREDRTTYWNKDAS